MQSSELTGIYWLSHANSVSYKQLKDTYRNIPDKDLTDLFLAIFSRDVNISKYILNSEQYLDYIHETGDTVVGEIAEDFMNGRLDLKGCLTNYLYNTKELQVIKGIYIFKRSKEVISKDLGITDNYLNQCIRSAKTILKSSILYKHMYLKTNSLREGDILLLDCYFLPKKCLKTVECISEDIKTIYDLCDFFVSSLRVRRLSKECLSKDSFVNIASSFKGVSRGSASLLWDFTIDKYFSRYKKAMGV